MNETEKIEAYLQNKLNAVDQVLMDTNYIMDEEFRSTVNWQKKAYALIRNYGRKKLKKEIMEVQKQLFSESKFIPFRNKIKSVFN